MSMPRVPLLTGLVLAGGRSRRMGSDKGSLSMEGQDQASRCFQLLQAQCAQVLVSINPAQRTLPAYRDLPVVVDDGDAQGPAAGLLSAWAVVPHTALLVLAVDMPRVDSELLANLVRQRNSAMIATAYRHPNGIIEPLCTIWEPAAAKALRGAVASNRSPSLRQILESGDGDTELLEPRDPAQLKSANTRQEFADAMRPHPDP